MGVIQLPTSSPPSRVAQVKSPFHGLQIQKRKLEKADILELSVKYMKSLQNSVQGRGRPWRVRGEELAWGALWGQSNRCDNGQIKEGTDGGERSGQWAAG